MKNIKNIFGDLDFASFGDSMLRGEFGLERENVRVDAEGRMAKTPHPQVFGNKNRHPYITTDFSESQVEMVTPKQDSIDEAYDFLRVLNDLFYENVKDEFLWPQSMPPVLPKGSDIPIAKYGEEGKDKEEYREYLSKMYGSQMQMISGTHFNFSLPDSLLRRLFAEQKTFSEFEAFKEQVYLKMIRNFLRDRWLLLLINGASPVIHETFEGCCLRITCPVENGVHSCKQSLSMRSSPFGYTNRKNVIIDYASVDSYNNSVERLIQRDFISLEKEIYLPIRLKFREENGKKVVSHIEVRILDLDPLSPLGVSKDVLRFTHLFLLYGLMREEQTPFDTFQQLRAHKNQYLASVNGMVPEFLLTDEFAKTVTIAELSKRIIGRMESTVGFLLASDATYKKAMEKAKLQVENPTERLAYKVREGIHEKGFVEFHMDLARKSREKSLEQAFRFHGKEDMELSTQLLMKEAVLRGVNVEIMDREENFLRLYRGDKEEYVIQATKTSLDTYSGVLKMENKTVTKDILARAGVTVPGGASYSDAEWAKSDFPLFQGRAVVVKPKSTNFGLGITILKENEDQAVYDRAVEIAFSFDKSVLVEEFAEGNEYRIFVIGDEVVGILRRVPANVTGDGTKTIRQLVEIKNQDPLRGKGYRTPLEKIDLGEAEAMFLAGQGYDFETVPDAGQTVYLRENSNISTGGDSVDYTDDIPQSYKDIAVQSTKAMGVQITGLDMIIKDIKEEATPDNYSIIEMNFNPAIHIHCFPFVGKNRKLNAKILDALGYGFEK
ncbi:glutathione biosynthesis bifunctional protein GshAB (plasmid) [Fulvitalea axinellae]|uniref:Glutamate--cysteine ligase n=1 Tax=Fulvitalea axinellae TaxID=1182444 RepID=A0AAU9CZE8_9BACT|nr:glutathione biosynthesis bifunctional protein GshAB [Fulvitalea axinellae]